MEFYENSRCRDNVNLPTTTETHLIYVNNDKYFLFIVIRIYIYIIYYNFLS